MNNHTMKGMSQILSLVVGAAILMMVAMLLMFSATDVIGGGIGEAELDSCTSQISAQCEVRASLDSPPGSCLGLSYSDVEVGASPHQLQQGEADNVQTVTPENEILCDTAQAE